VAGATVLALRSQAVSVEGTGMGHEELRHDDVLEPGMVVAVEVIADGVVDGAVVHVTPAGPQRLS
jgi:hypothetical protein